MDTVIEKLTTTTTDPDILKACYRFERLTEEKETIKNGMKWMRKEVLQAFESYRTSAGYNKVCLMSTLNSNEQLLSYGLVPFSKPLSFDNSTLEFENSPNKMIDISEF